MNRFRNFQWNLASLQKSKWQVYDILIGLFILLYFVYFWYNNTYACLYYFVNTIAWHKVLSIISSIQFSICAHSSLFKFILVFIWKYWISFSHEVLYWSTRPTTVLAGSDHYIHTDCPSFRRSQNFKINKQKSLPAGTVGWPSGLLMTPGL